MLRISKRISIRLSQFKYHNHYRSFSSSTASISLKNNNLKIGDNLHGYEIRRIEDVPELCLTAYLLHHHQSGAQHLHIAREDSNNVFGVSFRTPPNDSTGVAHILEHLALCGSKQFPVRDPFMKMLHRSMATFMNAFTGADYTMYPFSTQNLKDYDNLLRIYLDAAFFPRLRSIDFLQEGWRLEHEDINNQSSPIVIKGVVFNEMKGVFSSQSAIYERYLFNCLFPSNTYSYESGGDPLHIPNLTHHQLKQFHADHYHPSNSRFYTYGNFPLESHLSLINEYILKKFNYNEQLKKSSFVPEQSKWTSPKQISIECQNDPLAPFPDKQTTVSVSYLLDNITNIHETFMLQILGSLLMEGPNSPLYQALIDSGLGSSYSPGSGFSVYTKQGVFSIGLQGLQRSDVKSVIDAIQRTFVKVSKEGFPNERIEALLHNIELNNKNQSTNFGLSLLMNINPIWNHDGDPAATLRVNDHVEYFNNQLKQNPNYLKDKIKEYFVKNTHKLMLEMSPSDKFEEKRVQKENDVLREKVSQLTAEDKQRIYKEGLELNAIQQKPEDLSLLPTLKVNSDIPRQISVTNIERANINGVPVQWCAQPTNGIMYFHAIANINYLPQHLAPYLPLFSSVITQLGAGTMDRNDLYQEILLRTGGLQSSVHIIEHPSEIDVFEKGLYFSSYCLERNIEHMFKLWNDIFTGVRFDDDDEYLMQLIKMSSAELTMGVPQSGHSYAMKRAASSVNSASQFRELSNGLSALFHFRKCAAKDDAKEIIKILKDIASIVFQKRGLRCAINAETPMIHPSLQIIERFIQNLPKVDMNPKLNLSPQSSSVPAINYEHHVFPFANNYLGKAQFCAQFNHDDYPKLKIASKLVSAKYLHREIREKGGAYGGGASINKGGVFMYYSYRDPNVALTLDAFNESVKWLLDINNYSQQDIDEAKLSTFQEVDYPIPPGNKGMELFINGISDQMKHEYRMKLLDVSKNDIMEVTKRYLTDSYAGISLIGPRSDLTVSDTKWRVIEEKSEH